MKRKEKGHKRISKRINKRKLLYELSGGVCCKCGKKLQNKRHRELKSYMTIDHVVPKSWGGSNRLSNMQVMCRQCNMRKSNNNTRRYNSVKIKTLEDLHT